MEIKVSEWATLPQQVELNKQNIEALQEIITSVEENAYFKTGETMTIDW